MLFVVVNNKQFFKTLVNTDCKLMLLAARKQSSSKKLEVIFLVMTVAAEGSHALSVKRPITV
jgi:hypothetical protein